MYAQVNGARLFFDVDGESLTPDGKTMRQKPTVIMAHGGPGGDHTVYKPYFSQLTDIAQVIYYDHRGNGRSDFSDETSWNLAQWGDDLKGLCDTLGIESPIVIGTSFGGFVTLSYATRHPGHAAGLVLISTAAKVNFQSVYNAFGRLGGNEIREIAEAYWENPTAEGRALYRDRCVPFYSHDRSASTDWLSRTLWRNETALWCASSSPCKFSGGTFAPSASLPPWPGSCCGTSRAPASGNAATQHLSKATGGSGTPADTPLGVV